MSREGTLILLGVIVVLSPFLGLPYSWLMWILPILGLAVLAQGIVLRMRRLTATQAAPTRETHDSQATS